MRIRSSLLLLLGSHCASALHLKRTENNGLSPSLQPWPTGTISWSADSSQHLNGMPSWTSSAHTDSINRGNSSSTVYSQDDTKVKRSSKSFTRMPSELMWFHNSQTILVLDDATRKVIRSADSGFSWTDANGLPQGFVVFTMVENPFDSQKAYILGPGTEHYSTIDQGKTWVKFTSRHAPWLESIGGPVIFHAKKTESFIWIGNYCSSAINCWREISETSNNGQSFNAFQSYQRQCMYSMNDPTKTDLSDDGIICLGPNPATVDSSNPSNTVNDIRRWEIRYFEKGVEVGRHFSKDDEGVFAMAYVGSYLVAAVKVMSSTKSLKLYVSVNGGRSFTRAKFPSAEKGTVQENAYTILPSLSHSLMVHVVLSAGDSAAPPLWGSVHSSNSNGTYFISTLDFSNRNYQVGIVDFEAVPLPKTEGIYLTNIVQNHEDLDLKRRRNNLVQEEDKVLKTKISYNAGAAWRLLTPPNIDSTKKEYQCVSESKSAKKPLPNEDCSLMLHGNTQRKTWLRMGSLYSAKAAPGVLVGVGNVGILQAWDSSNTFLSQDAGLSWMEILKGPYKFAIGDFSGLIVLAKENELVDSVLYTTDRGQSLKFASVNLDGSSSKKFKVHFLTADIDSTADRFIVFAQGENGRDYFIISLDFGPIQTRQCEDKDMEDFALDPRGDKCFMGQRNVYRRRKFNAQCRMNTPFTEVPVKSQDTCECKREDLECDWNFSPVTDSGKLECRADSDWDRFVSPGCSGTYMGSSGFQKIPGNVCKGGEGEKIAERVQRNCPKNAESKNPGAESVIKSEKEFNSAVARVIFFPGSTITIMLTESGNAFWSDTSKTGWVQVLEEKGKVLGMGAHETEKSWVYFFTQSSDGSRKAYYTQDRLEAYVNNKDKASVKELGSMLSFTTISGIPVLDHHPLHKDWLIFIGEETGDSRRTVARFTKDHGATWAALPGAEYVTKCNWAQGLTNKVQFKDDQILCMGYDIEKVRGKDMSKLSGDSPNTPMQFSVFDDTQKKRVLVSSGVKTFYVVGKAVFVAVEKGKDLALFVTNDGTKIDPVLLPPDFVDDKGYTILDSSTGDIFMTVMDDEDRNREHGTLLISDSTGRYFQRSIDSINQNSLGRADFDRLVDMNGVLLANVVINAHEKGVKKVQSRINFNDGWRRKWMELTKNGSITLHLHSHSSIEQTYDRDYSIYSSKNAPGILMGVGNEGSYLGDYEQGNTYLSLDAGHTWKNVQTGPHLYAHGDSGSLLILVRHWRPTDTLLYSWNRGESWKDFRFTDELIDVNSIVSNPSGRGLVLHILGSKAAGSRGFEGTTFDATNTSSVVTKVVTVDFRKQLLGKDLACGDADFEDFKLSDEDKEICFNGQSITYKRRQSRICVIGPVSLVNITAKFGHCDCQDSDYECDVNHWRDESNNCVLYVEDPLRPENCPKGTTYTGSSGYIKSVFSQCVGGVVKPKTVAKDCDKSGLVGRIGTSLQSFPGEIEKYFYLDSTEIVFVLRKDGQVHWSRNGGGTWKLHDSFNGKKIITLSAHDFDSKKIYALTETSLWISRNEGQTFQGNNLPENTVPASRSSLFPDSESLRFHALNMDYLIFIGSRSCEGSCQFLESFYSIDDGKNWIALRQYVKDCVWGHSNKDIVAPEENAVLCTVWQHHSDEKNQLQFSPVTNNLTLARSANFFKITTDVLPNVDGIGVTKGFLIVTERVALDKIVFRASKDAYNFMPARLPDSFKHSYNGYTVLDSFAGNLMVDVSIVPSGALSRSVQIGSLFYSNTNGSYFLQSLSNTYRHSDGFVEYERIAGLEGFLIVNTIENPTEVMYSGADAKIVTRISIDDGRTWNALTVPKDESCVTPCSLHLHPIVHDYKSELSSASAPGFVIGLGRTGLSISTTNTEANTYLSRDGGQSWVFVKQGRFMSAFGDSGGVIVLLKEDEFVDQILYSTDNGNQWNSFRFLSIPGGKMKIDSISTSKAGTSRRFILWGELTSSTTDSSQAAVQLDFSDTPTGIRQCEHKDLKEWSPHDGCFFGHNLRYSRRMDQVQCLLQDAAPPPIESSCPCTEADFECATGYEPASPSNNNNGECIPIPGFQPVESACIDGKKLLSSGHVRYTKCQGGVQKDVGIEVSCGSAASGLSGGKKFGIVSGSFIAAAVATILWIRFGAGMMRNRIELPNSGPASGSNSSLADAVVRVGQIVITVAQAGWNATVTGVLKVYDAVRGVSRRYSGRASYSSLPTGA